MNRDQTHDLSSRGHGEWNQWIRNLPPKPKPFNCHLDITTWRTVGADDASQNWLGQSLVDFGNRNFNAFANFANFEFPADACFRDSVFSEGVTFRNAIFRGATDFSMAHFTKGVNFQGAVFQGHVQFGDAIFDGDANFRATNFVNEGDFRGANRAAITRFSNTKFRTRSYFDASKFSGMVVFDSCEFDDAASFTKISSDAELRMQGCQFFSDFFFLGSKFSNHLEISECTFQRFVNFKNMEVDCEAHLTANRFFNDVSFSSARSKVFFSLAGTTFAFPPDFRDASFHRIPRLDDVTIERQLYQPKAIPNNDIRPMFLRKLGVCRDPDYQGYFHVLRRLAAESNDPDRALEFFAQQIRTRRFWHDQPFNPKRGMARFWFGMIYDKLSDFGRSLSRPLLVWLILVLACALLLLGMRPEPQAELTVNLSGNPHGLHLELRVPSHECLDRRTSGAISEALYLSIRNSFVFMPSDRSEASTRALSCLYGYDESRHSAVIPIGASLIFTIQTVLSGVLFFLILLAIRNLLRMG